ncbi:origin recognition complex subunit 5, ORC5 [Chondrus crispus]|uniref:Origin recognition complex subunit 5, ORC5 n=1 Tax=Chondrus crispus TaxID=2769 RepID=R7QNM9_CHOCR|nr:origin recognition complex subunit 5, ORC5 [Chondrus crispus]CDF40107.1 origin recognition complex subunit 5, ORC5 [Chondrus crispus]|eukprot:XP_005710401.1 origin recognition complex subunit 5, ORC5 [Chondrus crispus]
MGTVHPPPRQAHLAQLRLHLRTSSPPLFLSGASSTGKYATLLAALPTASFLCADCVQSHSDRLLFGALTQSTPCDLPDFLARLNAASTSVLVLRRAERLTTLAFSPHVAAVLLALPALAARPDLHIVFLSRAPWPVFRRALPPADAAACARPLALFFAPYGLAEVVDAIVAAPPPTDRALHRGFVATVVDALYPSTNDLPELAAVCAALFPKYVAAWHAASTRARAPAEAFNAVNPLLAAALRDLYRESHGVSRETVLERGKRRREMEGGEQRKATYGLSRASVTMVVAAYLAACNPPATDVRYFTAERTRRARKGRGGASVAKRRRRGGRAFPLERLLAIYEAIRDVDELLEAGDKGTAGNVSAAVSTATLVQVNTLVKLHYLSREGSGDPISEPRFRCNVAHAQALDFSRLVGIELDQFVHHDGTAA